jgi:hypothetical protein
MPSEALPQVRDMGLVLALAGSVVVTQALVLGKHVQQQAMGSQGLYDSAAVR